MSMQKIGKMNLKNSGEFSTRIQYAYLNYDNEKQLTKQSGDIPPGQSLTVDPCDLGVSNGSTIFMHAFVLWGLDNQALREFLYENGNQTIAYYTISGTTLINDLSLTDLSK